MTLPICLAVTADESSADQLETTLALTECFIETILLATLPVAQRYLDDPRLVRVVILHPDRLELAEAITMRVCSVPWVMQLQAGEWFDPEVFLTPLGRATVDAEAAKAGSVAILAASDRAVIRLRNRDRWTTGQLLVMDGQYQIASVGLVTPVAEAVVV